MLETENKYRIKDKSKWYKDKDEKITQTDLYWFGQTTAYIQSLTSSWDFH